ncbi:hypothetical protein NLG97_g5652 [Lecanicillium saksenae]|uniref:Uncharacterized protein n=1 Tax=Lecanicillium saksenae TaxID=468837 RepID=A0ACC1QS12_9HYPO|nr:hypothetical protein NLG97_g5652 [Lecanicillium saksenae]
MHWTAFMAASTPLITLGRSHTVIPKAQGSQGSPASQDTTIIRDAEIVANGVNQCGHTELKGNIDVGENTETALPANSFTRVRASSTINITIHQVNADGAGPFFCDLDQTNNSGTNLQLRVQEPSTVQFGY